MEIFKDGDRTITLATYSIERETIGEPVIIRAELQIATPKQRPTMMRVRVRYQSDDIPHQNELALGQRIVQLLRNRVAD
jgi:hypothetical protein